MVKIKSMALMLFLVISLIGIAEAGDPEKTEMQHGQELLCSNETFNKTFSCPECICEECLTNATVVENATIIDLKFLVKREGDKVYINSTEYSLADGENITHYYSLKVHNWQWATANPETCKEYADFAPQAVLDVSMAFANARLIDAAQYSNVTADLKDCEIREQVCNEKREACATDYAGLKATNDECTKDKAELLKENEWNTVTNWLFGIFLIIGWSGFIALLVKIVLGGHLGKF